MCGIYALFSKNQIDISLSKEAEKAKDIKMWDIDKKFTGKLKDSFKAIEPRGPDCCEIVTGYYAPNEYKLRGAPVGVSCDRQFVEHCLERTNYLLGFTRLSINDLTWKGMQPFSVHTVLLICNGEIYNHKQLEKDYDITPESHSDCEVIAHLYLQLGIEKTISLLDGVYAFVLVDTKTGNVYFSRDRIGVRPLFYAYSTEEIGEREQLMIASEAKPFEKVGLPCGTKSGFYPKQLCPQEYGWFDMNTGKLRMRGIHSIPMAFPTSLDERQIIYSTRERLVKAVQKRLMSDREIGCMLSGGLDSSIIAAILTRISPKKLNTFSIGFEDSTDLRYAREVSTFLNTNHHEVIITKEEAMKSLPDVIYAIESYDTTTVRASVGMYLLSKYITENFQEKVIFSGEGSDEIFGGYLYFHFAPTDEDFEKESHRLITELPYYDVLRADRCTASHGLELRVPFLDKDIIDYCATMPASIRKPREGYEKWILRKAFEGYIPDSVLWRRKQGFSDAIGGPDPWYKCIQDYAETIITDKELTQSKFDTKEDFYYYRIFSEKFKKLHKPSGYWRPRWVKEKDPSNMALEKMINFKTSV